MTAALAFLPSHFVELYLMLSSDSSKKQVILPIQSCITVKYILIFIAMSYIRYVIA